ncbi:hypothetical protein PNP85_00525 [Halobacterium salinarum]|uniref:hypothetical protein n=1 Tax=Halobacterium salinarum TaxID=2242 RepID=UPI0025566AA7|nr:hypothetical protein [Halobacterium salinarum]MDL0138000.1 hypothetical protein [Halobacterium salinarum]
MSRFGGWGVVVAVLFVVVMPLSSGGVVFAADQPGESVAGVSVQVADPVNNSSTGLQQEKPNQVGEDGDTAALQNWLQTRLSEQLQNSSIQISQGQYEDAQGVLGEEYENTLSKYIEVAGETETEADDELGRQLNETAQAQTEYAQTLAEYQTTYEAYQTARENGNDQRARRLARQLNEITANVTQLNRSLTTTYETLAERTGIAFQNETEAVANTTQTVTEQTTAVVRTVFTPTNMTATADATGSFLSPIRITGTVTSAGTAPLNGTVQLTAPGRVVRSDVEANRSFELVYRPTAAATGQLVANVTYVPAANGTYLGSSTGVQTNVTQVSPTLHVTKPRSTVQYRDPIGVTGRVTVANRTVPNTPVQLRFNGTVVGEARTNAMGEYNVSTPLPAAVPAGTQPLTVQVGASRTALAPTVNATNVSVAETPTNLTLATTRLDDTVAVRGRLQTDDEHGIESQRVTVKHENDVVQTVTTNASGRFETEVPLSAVAGSNTTVQITGTFSGDTTNLASAQATSTITLPRTSGLLGTELPSRLMLVVGGGAVGLLGAGYVFYRFRETGGQSIEEPNSTPATTPDSSTPTSASAWDQQMDIAVNALENNNLEQAVTALYSAVRATYAAASEEPKTHWAFFTSVRGELSASQQDVLRQVTEAYEAVQFADAAPAEAEVVTLFDEVQTVLEEERENRNLNPTGSQSSE